LISKLKINSVKRSSKFYLVVHLNKFVFSLINFFLLIFITITRPKKLFTHKIRMSELYWSLWLWWWYKRTDMMYHFSN